MKRMTLISDSPHAGDLNKSIGRYLRQVNFGWQIDHINAGPRSMTEGKESVAAFFCRIVGILSRHEHREIPAVAIIELVDSKLEKYQDIHASNEGCPWVQVVCMLVLSFPDIHWVFQTPYPAEWLISSDVPGLQGDQEFFRNSHIMRSPSSLREVLALCESGYEPLFDPTAFRHCLRMRMKAWDRSRQDFPSIRPWLGRGAAIDEEAAYAYFNAFVLYRQGFVSHVVLRYKQLGRLFSKEKVSSEVPDVIFEDLYLSFPDQHQQQHLSNLSRDRREQLPRLEDVRHRIFVTVGRGSEVSKEIWRQNKTYLIQQRGRGQSTRMIYKPGAGIFPLWDKAGLTGLVRRLDARARMTSAPTQRGHSAPGRLLLIADVLIARARSLLSECRTVEDAVRAATFAIDAQALLGGKTPTTSLEALALQHEAEVLAESLFVGIEYNIDVKSRLRELKGSVASVAARFHQATRDRASMSARLTIIERIGARFRNLHQVDEEMICLAEARKLRFMFWAQEKWWRWPLWPILRYLAFSLHSLTRFVAVVVGWAMMFGVSYYIFGYWSPRQEVSFWNSMVSAWRFFFTLSLAPDWGTLVQGSKSSWNDFWNFWLTLQGIVSSTNLGLLLSHLYLIVARR